MKKCGAQAQFGAIIPPNELPDPTQASSWQSPEEQAVTAELREGCGFFMIGLVLIFLINCVCCWIEF